MNESIKKFSEHIAKLLKIVNTNMPDAESFATALMDIANVSNNKMNEKKDERRIAMEAERNKILVRIALLKARGTNNGAIVKKLERKLRKLK